MVDTWNTVIQSVLTVGMTAFFAWRLERLRGEQAKALQRSDTDRSQYLEAFKADQAKGIEGVKAQLLVLTRLHAGLEEKRAEVAAEVLVSTLQYLNALRSVTNAFHMGGAPGTKFVDVVQARWQASREAEAAFNRGWVLAEAFLPEPIAEFMDRIADKRSDIWAAQDTHFAVIEQEPRDQQFRYKGWGSEPEAALAKLRNEAKERLRPIIQHEKALAAEHEATPHASLPAAK